MTGPGPDGSGRALTDLASQAVDLVRAAAGPAAQAEVTVTRADLALTRFANSMIHQNVAEANVTVRLRVHHDGHTATGTTTLTSPDGLRTLVGRTLDAARRSPADPGWPGLAPPARPAGTGAVDPAIVTATPADRAGLVRAFIDAAGGLATAGYCRTRHLRAAFANSAGHLVHGGTTEAAMDGIASTVPGAGQPGHTSAAPGAGDGVARLAGPRLADLDGAVLGARAAAKALAGRDPVELPPGRYEVVLEPTAVDDLLGCLAVYGFNGKAVTERRSFAAVGEAQFDPAVTIVDDGVSPGMVGLPFDAEGTVKHRVELVRAGRTVGVAHDRRTAAVAGTGSTGNAGDVSWGPVPANLAILPSGGLGTGASPGTGPAETPGPVADAATAALVASVRRGLLVTDHWYTRVLDPRTLVMTGLTRNGVWLIEDGEIVRPVRNLRFTQSYPQALAPGAVLGVGGHTVALPSGWYEMSYRSPALHLASWNFTGGASG